MAKKKDKKGKKDKKAKADQTEQLSNLDKEKYLLTIAELEHKIEWRRHLCKIIEENKKMYEEGCESQEKDKNEAVSALRDAIEEQKDLAVNIGRAVAEAEKRNLEIQEDNAMRLARKLRKMQEDTALERSAIDEMQKELECLENYDSEKEEQELQKIEGDLRKDPLSEGLDKRMAQDKRRVRAFNKKIADLVGKERAKFDAELEATANQELRQLEAENDWLSEQVNFLKETLERQKFINEEEAATLEELKESAKREKRATEKFLQDLCDKEIAILKRKSKTEEPEKQRISSVKDGVFDEEKENAALVALRAEEDFVIRSIAQIRDNEEEIRCLEETLSKEVAFGEYLQSFLERAWEIIEKEAKTPLILTYNGPPETKKTVGDLRKVLDEATKYIYERGNRTML